MDEERKKVSTEMSLKGISIGIDSNSSMQNQTLSSNPKKCTKNQA